MEMYLLSSLLPSRTSSEHVEVRSVAGSQSTGMLPYSSLEEAAASLGRPLSRAEILWFTYTAATPDYFMHAFVVFLSLCVVFLCPLPLVVIEAMSPSLIHKFKIQPDVMTPISRVLQCYKDVLITFLAIITPIELISLPLLKTLGFRASLPLPSLWEAASQLLVYFLVEDYGNYWIHRWMHWPWAYDKIHHVHHEFSSPFGFCPNYAHWLDLLIPGLPTIVGPLLVPCHVVTLCAWAVLRQMESIEAHCGYDFPWNPTKLIPFYGGAVYHDYHHFVGKSQSNFAPVFTYCDYIYGTNKGYRYQKAYLAELRALNNPAEKMRMAGSPAAGSAETLHNSSRDLKSQ